MEECQDANEQNICLLLRSLPAGSTSHSQSINNIVMRSAICFRTTAMLELSHVLDKLPAQYENRPSLRVLDAGRFLGLGGSESAYN